MELIVEKQTSQFKYPDDWDVLNLGKSSVLKARIGWQGLTTAEYLDAGEYYLITGTDFKDGYIDWDNCVYVEKLRYDQDKNIQVHENDVLVTKDGTIGKVAFVNNVPKRTTLNSGVFVIRPIHKSYYPRYFYYVLMSEHFKDFLGKLTAGSTISHLYQKDFVHYEFPLPPTLTEQKAIATALSDVDELISNLDKRIVKKKAMKQGAMQALLTGKIRVKGFEGSGKYKKTEVGQIPKDWIVNYLSELGQIDSESLTSKTSRDYKFKYISLEDVKQGVLKGYSEVDFASAPSRARRVVQKGDILFGTVRPNLQSHLLIKDEIKHLICSTGFAVLKVNKLNYENRLVYQHLFSNSIDSQINGLLVGSNYPAINSKEFKNLKIPLPPTLTEQQAIAKILSDMDADIAQLEGKKSKLQLMKHGMMQELLTGKTRLI